MKGHTVKSLAEYLLSLPEQSAPVLVSMYSCGNTFQERLTEERLRVKKNDGAVVIDAEDN